MVCFILMNKFKLIWSTLVLHESNWIKTKYIVVAQTFLR